MFAIVNSHVKQAYTGKAESRELWKCAPFVKSELANGRYIDYNHLWTTELLDIIVHILNNGFI